MSTVNEIIEIEKRARSLGITLLIGVDNRLKLYPFCVASKHLKFVALCHRHRHGIMKWLQIMASPAPTSLGT